MRRGSNAGGDEIEADLAGVDDVHDAGGASTIDQQMGWRVRHGWVGMEWVTALFGWIVLSVFEAWWW